MHRSFLAITLVILSAHPALAERWGADVSTAWTADGMQVGIHTRYLWASNELSVGVRAYPPGLRDALPVGAQTAYRYRFGGDWVRPLMGPEYQLTRHRGGTLHALFWNYGIEIPVKFGIALEQSIGLGASYIHGARRVSVAPDVLARVGIVYRADW